jgi:hypothetical protein
MFDKHQIMSGRSMASPRNFQWYTGIVLLSSYNGDYKLAYPRIEITVWMTRLPTASLKGSLPYSGGSSQLLLQWYVALARTTPSGFIYVILFNPRHDR